VWGRRWDGVGWGGGRKGVARGRGEEKVEGVEEGKREGGEEW